VKLDLVDNRKTQGLKLAATQFFKFWVWHEYFGLIIVNYFRNLVKFVLVSVLIFFFYKVTNGFLSSFLEAFCCRLLIFEFPTRVNIYVLMGEMWKNDPRTQKMLLYSSPNDDIAHIAVQLQPNYRVQKMLIIVLII